MLTQDQIDKLQLLTQHSKFGKLLQDAIEVWKRKDVAPVHGSFGIYDINNKFVFDPDDECNNCCLVGAALYNKNVIVSDKEIFTPSASKAFNLSNNEIRSLFAGFDKSSFPTHGYKPYDEEA